MRLPETDVRSLRRALRKGHMVPTSSRESGRGHAPSPAGLISRASLPWPQLTVPIAMAMAFLLLLGPLAARAQEGGGRPSAPVQTEAGVRGPSIILTRSGVDPANVAADNGISTSFVYRNVTTGFAADLTDANVTSLQHDGNVVSIAIDRPISAADYSTQIRRIGADNSSATGIGSGGSVNAGIAILDSGVNSNGIINVVDGTDCTGSGTGYSDQYGHGTEVAAIAAARDSGDGVVGIAPGARIYAVKVLDASGNGTLSQATCGLDWVAGHGGIDVANLSLSGFGPDGACSQSTFHQAICDLTASGVPVVAAAGNYGEDASGTIPATYEQVVAVSSYSDTDGRMGGRGGTCVASSRYVDQDDHFSSFSNYGGDVDIMAPGGCDQTINGSGQSVTVSGTSYAAPLVAGGLAIFGSISAMSTTQSAAGVIGGKSGEPVLMVGPTSGSPTATATAAGTRTPTRPAGATSTPRPPRSTSTPRPIRGTSTPTRVAGSTATATATATPTRPSTATPTRAAGSTATATPTRPAGATSTPRPPRGTSTPRPVRGTSTPTPGSAAQEVNPAAVSATDTPRVSRATSTAMPSPTETATTEPTETATVEPTETSTVEPTATDVPTDIPTDIPTEEPTDIPTDVPTETPTIAPVAVTDTLDQASAVNIIDDDTTTAWYMDVVSDAGTENTSATPGVDNGGQVPADQDIVLDLGVSQPIDRVRYQWAETTYASGVEIQVSDDGENWTTIAYPDTVNQVPGEWQTAPAGVTARFVRFLFPDPDGLGAVGGLSEVEIVPVNTESGA